MFACVNIIWFISFWLDEQSSVGTVRGTNSLRDEQSEGRTVQDEQSGENRAGTKSPQTHLTS